MSHTSSPNWRVYELFDSHPWRNSHICIVLKKSKIFLIIFGLLFLIPLFHRYNYLHLPIYWYTYFNTARQNPLNTGLLNRLQSRWRPLHLIAKFLSSKHFLEVEERILCSYGIHFTYSSLTPKYSWTICSKGSFDIFQVSALSINFFLWSSKIIFFLIRP